MEKLWEAARDGDTPVHAAADVKERDEQNMAMEKLRDAARDGDINKLYESIRLDPYVLERIDAIPFGDTPVHAAAYGGHTNLGIEMMRLKTSLGRKLNPDGFSPLDVALRTGHTDTARRLVKFDSELIRVQGKEGFTPLHYVVETDKIELLAEFLVACPQSIEDLTVRGETAVHIAAVKGHVSALKVLLGWVRRAFDVYVLNWKDEKGNTALHLAALQYTTAQHSITIDPLEVLRLLANRVDSYAKNLEGLTAFDIVSLSQLPNHVKKEAEKIVRPRPVTVLFILFESYGDFFRSLSAPDEAANLAQLLSGPEKLFEVLVKLDIHMRMTLTNEDKNALLVVAVLIMTATYQAALSPPTGLTIELTPYYSLSVFPLFVVLNTITLGASAGIIIGLLRTKSFSFRILTSLFFLFLTYMVLIVPRAHAPVPIAIYICSSYLIFSILLERAFLFMLKIGLLPWFLTRPFGSLSRLQLQQQVVRSRYSGQGGQHKGPIHS